ncbi:GNAT family N-acetyltransferase [Bacteroidota bacterium]
MISIKALNGISIETIHDAFTKAFSDYVEPIDLTLKQLQHMIERRGYTPELSFGAFSEEKLVGFTLNGTGEWEGELTAYDTGTGIVKEFRKQGIASRMFKESLPVLREYSIKQYLLEVIVTNTSAYELYKKAGFKVTRNFDYFVSTKDKISIEKDKLRDDLELKIIKTPDWKLFKSFWDFTPSWQNSIDAIKRKFEYFAIIGLFENEKLLGYGIIERHSGDIAQIAVDKSHRKEKIGTTLLHHLFRYAEIQRVKIVNSVADNESIRKFATRLGFPAGLGQYEMLLKL